MSTITAQIQLRRDTSANWTSNNPILLAGEMALSTDVLYAGTDQPRYKIGNGVDTWLNLDYVPEGGTSSYPENLFLTVVNKTGDNLLATGYKVLKVQDAQGQRLAVDYALADSNGNSTDTIGIVYENIDNNQSGRIVVIGELTGLNTTGSLQGETWQDGDVLYLSSSTPGNLTKVQPIAPNHLVVVGYVVYAHANQGKIYCKVQNGWELGELHDVYAPSPSNNDGIFWSSGTTRYENKSIASALGYTPENTLNKSIDGTFASNSDTLYPSQKAVKTYADSLVTGLLDDRGNYDASSNLFPSSGGSGTAGAILKGDLWYISTGGTLGGTSVVVGSSVRALIDSPGQTSSNWSILNVGLGYTPENSANKGVANGYASLDSSGKVPIAQLNLFNFYFFQSASTNLTDATNYYMAYCFESLSTTEAFRQFNFDASETIKELYLTSLHAAAGSSENVTIYIRNITTATDYLVGTFKEDFTLNTTKTFAFTGLNIAVNSTNFWTVKIKTPTFVTNPVAVRYAIKVKTI